MQGTWREVDHSGVGSGGGAMGPMAPPIILKGVPGLPNVFPCLYYIRCCSATLCDVFNKQTSFKTMLSEVHKLVLLLFDSTCHFCNCRM